ncbi:MAG: potassium channel family protein [Caldisphaeraceae archaeon]|nr:potassium channel family protein [Caldisphaeraceae archaeon]
MLFLILAKFRRFLRNNFAKITIMLIAIVAYGTFSEYYIEKGLPGSGIKNLFDSFWFVIQTITTVGYGNTPIVSFWGKVNAILLMLFGIGSLSLFIASFTDVLVESDIARKFGELKAIVSNHNIICNWNEIGEELVSELLKETDKDIVLIAETPSPPLKEIDFVKGSCLKEDDLKKANVEKAEGAIILADARDASVNPTAIDAKTILAGLRIKKLNSNCHVVAELLSSESVEYAKMVGIDDYIIRGYVSAKLLSKTLNNPKVSQVIDLIISARSGDEIFEEELPECLKGKKYKDIVSIMMMYEALPIALRSSKGLRINPSREEVVNDNSIIYIAKKPLNIKKVCGHKID